MFLLLCAPSSLIHTVVSAGRNESWLYNLGADEVVICGTDNLGCRKRSQHAQDGQALLAFVVSNYERLHNLRMAFVHGGEKAWHSRGDIREAIQKGWYSEEFIHLGKASNRKCMDMSRTGWCEHIFKPQNVSCDMTICTYQGLQFVANGKHFCKLARAQYEGMEATCNGMDVPPREFGNRYKGCSYAMEYFGQTLASNNLIAVNQDQNIFDS